MWPFRMPPRRHDPREWIVITESTPPEHCWLNEDCIAGHHMDETECQFPPDEPTSCPCECHKPTHEARKPSPLTMIGRGNG